MPWTAAGLIAAWESASGLTPPLRTAVLLNHSGCAQDLDSALDTDVGTAASLIFGTYAQEFGALVDVVTSCPQCGEQLEAQVKLPSGSGPAASARVVDTELRLPTLRELDLVRGSADPGAALRELCMRPGTAGTPAATADEEDNVDAAVEELADAATLRGRVTCPGCGATFEMPLDAGALLWDRVRIEGQRLTAEVVALAAGFGWSETEILSLSAFRRRTYLDLVGAP